MPKTITASPGQTVFYDSDDARGPWTFELPLAPSNGWEVEFQTTDLTGDTPVTWDGNGKNINVIQTQVVAPSLNLFPPARVMRFQFNAGRDEWMGLWDIQAAELWQATPVTNMSGQTIQWTFVPLAPGQTPQLFTHSAGEFTPLTEANARCDIRFEVDQILAVNNADVDLDFTPIMTGTGLFIFPRIIDSFAHSRSGTFPSSKIGGGLLSLTPSDSFRIDCSSAGTGGSTVDMTAGILLFETY